MVLIHCHILTFIIKSLDLILVLGIFDAQTFHKISSRYVLYAAINPTLVAPMDPQMWVVKQKRVSPQSIFGAVTNHT